MNPLSTLQPVADFRAASCKVCEGPSPLFGVIDFHKSCLENQGKRLPLSGYPVYYRRCSQCGFVFTNAFDAWTHADFHQYIYNDEYIVVDPDFSELRPTGNAKMLMATFEASRASINVLDYGGGAGLTADLLRQQGFSATTYDPFSAFNVMPTERFDLICCFEVMEHVPSPKETVATMVSLLRESGAILFSTMLQPQDFDTVGLNWWYAGPRNGHVSLYSGMSLGHLFREHGMNVNSFSEGLHIAYRDIPAFASHILTAG